MITNLRIRHRIMLGFAISFLFSAVFLTVIYWTANRTEREELLGDRSDAALMQLYKLQTAYDDMVRVYAGYVMGEKVDIAKVDQGFNKEIRDISKPLVNLMETAEERELVRNLIDKGHNLDTALDKVVDAAKTRKRGDAINVFLASNAPIISRDLKTLMTELESIKTAETRDHKNKSMRALLILRVSIIGSMILTALLALGISIWIARQIGRSLSEAISAMSSTSTEIAATVAEHERVASQQAAMVNQTSTTMEELSASSRQSAEQSEGSVEAAQKASMLVTEGSRLVTQTVEAMDDLKGKVGAVAERILRLGEQTGQIGNIAEILKELATQINMLALNAAVEAARAGEHGKGFAVVASEVRKLAVESKKSAEQTKTIVADIQAATSSTVISTEEGTRKAEDVTSYARKLGEFFEGLSEAADVGYDNAQQGLLNAKQQSMAINQVVSATNSINAGARETAAGITQTREGLQRLNEAARTLQVMV